MKKKIVALLLAVCLVFTIAPVTAFALTDNEKLAIIESVMDTSWYTENVNASDYHISTAAGLWGLAYYGMSQKYISFEGKTIYLDADIDLQGFPDWMTMYTSITNYTFKGTLDGQNHIISNLKGETFFGAVINSTIQNLNISDAVINGGSILAVQVAASGVIDKCIVSGSATGGNNGGAISGLTAGTVTNCITMATIIANTNSGAGGLVYNSNNDNAVITGNYVLNKQVVGKRPISANVIGRVIGYHVPGYSLKGTLNNYAYEDTEVLVQDGISLEIVSNASGRDGQSISLVELYNNGIMDRIPENFPIPEYLADPREPAVDKANRFKLIGNEKGGSVAREVDVFLALNGALDPINLVEVTVSYDAANFDVVPAVVLENALVRVTNNDKEAGKVSFVIGAANEGNIGIEDYVNIAKLLVTPKEGVEIPTTYVTLDKLAAYSKGTLVEFGFKGDTGIVNFTYFDQYDINRDGIVNAADLSLVLFYFGAKEGDDNWEEARIADLNGDGVVDTADISILINILYPEQ